jgi:hypothetical protein
MKQNHKRLGRAAAAVAAVATVLAVPALGNTVTAPSSSQSPYLVRSEPGVVSKSILTVGDSVNLKPDDATPYRMVGIPDGLGAFDNGDGTFTVLMNQELGATVGIARAHGARGAFVSKWTIDKETLAVTHGEDLIQQIALWDAVTGDYLTPAQGIALARLCSATLAPISAFFDADSGKGYDGHLFTNGEENGAAGRAFAHALDGTSYELPALGKMDFENVVPNGGTGERTIVAATDDSGGGQVYVYAGDKQTSGNAVDRAGLGNGRLFGIKVAAGFTAEDAANGIPAGTRFSGYDLGDVRRSSGAALETASVAGGVTGFQRPEDAAWDPQDPRVLYFVTTASFDGNSRLWRLTFDDPTDPATGGTIDMLLDGTEGQHMLDNITVNGRGQVLIQEDPGNQSHIAKVWRYTPSIDRLSEVAHHDPARFLTGASGFLTQDEESSGILDVSDILGEGWYLADVQAHYALGGELVEGGQLLALHVPPGRK